DELTAVSRQWSVVSCQLSVVGYEAARRMSAPIRNLEPDTWHLTPALAKPQLLLCRLAQAADVPGRLPHHLHVGGLHPGDLSNLLPHLLADEAVSRATPCRQGHHHIDVVVINLHVVNQSQVHEIDWNFRVITLAQNFV